ncbi:hypothetical protein SCALIN_C16_0040 [Candidatus Scalindua japonica]|uniref:NACHT C-terminal Helical domain-containing protein n=1 Tax=Candidatus Scalindua japonica TaxID=1284222 RepID=A0A286TYM1_9BACT|nr:hypothetical protein [Candidatus Scalindua japonica]GAX60966.1 hypothetical protein SCALIN_C16_0040 [Candidatus Scalindua japonica]
MDTTRDNKFIDNRIYSLSWRNIYFFYLGLIKDCEDIINKIQITKPVDSNERFWRFVNMGDYLLAAYSTPYSVIEKTILLIIKEAQTLYKNIKDNKIDSPLRNMPEMFVLEFFQAVTCSCYAFKFFKKAMDSAILDIASDTNIKDEDKAYLLFFISCVYRALGEKNPFDGLIDKLDDDLPFPVKLGIYYENKHLTHQSTILKRNLKKLKQQMKKNPALSQYYNRLHELPISQKKIEIKSK